VQSGESEWKIIFCAVLFVMIGFRFTSSARINPASSHDYNDVRKQSKMFNVSDYESIPTGGSRAPSRPVTPPEIYDNLVDLDTEWYVKKPKMGLEVPLFWHLPRSGGSTVKEVLAKCLGITMASETGARDGHAEDHYLQTLFMYDAKYVNVDTTTAQGLQRAKELNLVSSRMAQVIVSPLAYEAIESLFDAKRWMRGIMFTVVRDPVERAASMFYFREMAKGSLSGDSSEQMKHMKEFFNSSKAENNWMTRILIKKITGPLYLEDLDLAKEILRRKCLIGLMTQKEASIRRFEAYFGWDKKTAAPGVSDCKEKLLFWGWANKNEVAPIVVEEGTDAYELIMRHNEFDLELYEYAKELYKVQGEMFSSATSLIPDDYVATQKTISASKSREEDEAASSRVAPLASFRTNANTDKAQFRDTGDEESDKSENSRDGNEERRELSGEGTNRV
jgi:hypothetical protein